MVDDTYLDIEVSTKRIHYKRQSVWLCHLKDITSVFIAERQLAEQRELLAKQLDTIPDQVACKSPEGRITGSNQSRAKGHNTSIENATGRTALELMPADTIKKHKDQEVVVLQDETYKTQEWMEQKYKACLFKSTKIPLYNKNNVISVLSIDHDISELGNLNKQVYDEQLRLI